MTLSLVVRQKRTQFSEPMRLAEWQSWHLDFSRNSVILSRMSFGVQVKLLYLSGILFLAAGCGSGNGDKKKAFEQPEGTRKMVARLAEINASLVSHLFDNPFVNVARAEALKQQIIVNKGRPVNPKLLFSYNAELMNAGKSKEASLGFQKVLHLINSTHGRMNQETKGIYDHLAIAFMRMGEQDNCATNHNGNSCILPLQSNALHTNKTGSQKAVEVYEAILKQYPDDLGSQWLLNVAHMTLGTFPDGVPEKWRLPKSTFISDGSFPRFENIAGDLGLDMDNHAGGCCTEDFNNDGFLDVMCSGLGLTDQLQLFMNNGDGTFTEKTEEAGLTGLVGGLNINHTDYNNDGFADVLVLRGGWLGKAGHYPNSLIKNNGDGTFEDVTYAAGIYSEHPTQNASWADVDLDGFLDLFIGNETANGDSSDCEFYFNNGDGTFTESAAKVGLNFRDFVKGSVWGDINKDGFPDLYVSTINSNNRLYLHQGGKNRNEIRFIDVAEKAHVQKPNYSFPTWLFDYDNDGWEDLFVCSYDVKRYKIAEDEVREILGLPKGTETLKMYHNNGDGTFTDATAQTGMAKVIYGMGANFGDLNNDGYLDFYIGTGNPDFQSIVPNKMFVNNGGKSFADVTTAGGFGHIQKGHGVAFSDLDNDGDQDVYIQIGGAYEGDNFRNALFENPGNKNHWIVLQLKGKTANKAAVGAFVDFTITENGKQRHIHRRVSTGGSFGSASLQLEVGLGQGSTLNEIKVTWPNKAQTVQTFTNVQVNQKYLLEEGVSQLKVVKYQKLQWQKKAPHDHSSHDHSHMNH